MSLHMDDIDINQPYSECPYCGSEEFYTKQKVSGKVTYIQRFDGEDADNGEMYDMIRHKTVGKYAYCLECNKRLFKVID